MLSQSDHDWSYNFDERNKDHYLPEYFKIGFCWNKNIDQSDLKYFWATGCTGNELIRRDVKLVTGKPKDFPASSSENGASLPVKNGEIGTLYVSFPSYVYVHHFDFYETFGSAGLIGIDARLDFDEDLLTVIDPTKDRKNDKKYQFISIYRRRIRSATQPPSTSHENRHSLGMINRPNIRRVAFKCCAIRLLIDKSINMYTLAGIHLAAMNTFAPTFFPVNSIENKSLSNLPLWTRNAFLLQAFNQMERLPLFIYAQRFGNETMSEEEWEKYRNQLNLMDFEIAEMTKDIFRPDLQFIMKNEQNEDFSVYAHSHILWNQSRYFQSIIKYSNKKEENDKMTIIYLQYPHDVILNIIYFCYTFQFSFEINNDISTSVVNIPLSCQSRKARPKTVMNETNINLLLDIWKTAKEFLIEECAVHTVQLFYLEFLTYPKGKFKVVDIIHEILDMKQYAYFNEVSLDKILVNLVGHVDCLRYCLKNEREQFTKLPRNILILLIQSIF